MASKKIYGRNQIGFENLSFPKPIENVSDYVPHDDDDIIREIFIPDPNTGVPKSDIFIMLNRSTDPVVREYIERVLMNPLYPSKDYGDDADLALELIQRDGEDVSAYTSRLKNIISASD